MRSCPKCSWIGLETLCPICDGRFGRFIPTNKMREFKIKVQTVRQPWAGLIINGFKPVENRSKRINHRGLLLIHAGSRFDLEGYDWVKENFPDIRMPEPEKFITGGIIGKVTVWDCVNNSPSPWAEPGKWHWLMKFPQRIDLIPCPGNLGTCHLPQELNNKIIKDV